jgi:hypothetical protein
MSAFGSHSLLSLVAAGLRETRRSCAARPQRALVRVWHRKRYLRWRASHLLREGASSGHQPRKEPLLPNSKDPLVLHAATSLRCSRYRRPPRSDVARSSHAGLSLRQSRPPDCQATSSHEVQNGFRDTIERRESDRVDDVHLPLDGRHSNELIRGHGFTDHQCLVALQRFGRTTRWRWCGKNLGYTTISDREASRRRRSFGSEVTMRCPRCLPHSTTHASITSRVLVAPQS